MTNVNDSDMPEDLTILVVDDDSVVRVLLEQLLSPKYTVLLAENGIQAWNLISENSDEIDVVLSDMHMPLLDGMGLLKRIRSEFPAICVIVLSGTSDINLAVQAMRKGAHDYIAKPFANIEELEIIMWRWFHQQSVESKLEQYATLHREMMRNMKARTFLSLDLVKSRGLKKNEDPFLVQFSFSAYHNFIAGIVEHYDGKIHSTAGDGVMACFTLPQSAIAAATEILAELETFNKSRNQLDRDFNLRLGIHTGSVIIEKNGRINEMFSETLDIAGHIQKGAKPNSIVLSEMTRESLEETENLIPVGQAIDGLQLYMLKPE